MNDNNHIQTTLKLFVLHDEKLSKFFPPFFACSEDDAKRMMTDAVNYKPGLISSFPQDYSLYYLGDFDDSNAFINADNPLFICCLKDLKRDDTTKYSELEKNLKVLEGRVANCIDKFNKTMDENNSAFTAYLKGLDDKFQSVIDKKIELFPIADKESDSKKSKDSFINKLFS